MKYTLTTILFLVSLNLVVSQTKTNLYEYNKKKENAAVVVQSQKMDSVTLFEKVILEGYDSKIPFYHYTNSRKKHLNTSSYSMV